MCICESLGRSLHNGDTVLINYGNPSMTATQLAQIVDIKDSLLSQQSGGIISPCFCYLLENPDEGLLDIFNSGKENELDSMEGYTCLEDIFGRSLNLGDIVLYKFSARKAYYGIVISSKEIFTDSFQVKKMHYVFKLTDLCKEEATVKEQITNSYRFFSRQLVSGEKVKNRNLFKPGEVWYNIIHKSFYIYLGDVSVSATSNYDTLFNTEIVDAILSFNMKELSSSRLLNLLSVGKLSTDELYNNWFKVLFNNYAGLIAHSNNSLYISRILFGLLAYDPGNKQRKRGNFVKLGTLYKLNTFKIYSRDGKDIWIQPKNTY
jgi:hypothetical protein